ncbi:MAG: AMIN domain-containing protein [Acidobacteriia bacterium]|nr:AMIN domain-containing protein [Terriglobia bacterium]
MHRSQTRVLLAGLLLGASVAATCPLFAAPQAAVSIRRVAVLGAGNSVEVEIEASGPVTPQAQVVSGPDRIVLDFPNALPGSALHPITVNRGEVKGVRTGLFSAKPPVTRVVLDLESAQGYQVFASGNRVIVKLSGVGEQTTAFNTQFEIVENVAVTSEGTVPAAQAQPPAKPAPRIEVEFRNGELSIWADKVTLAELLNEVHRKTGADIPIPAGAEQELVVANLGPAPAQDVLALLLNGSRFNFIMVGSSEDPAQLRSVLLSPKGGAMRQPIAYPPPTPVAQSAPPPAPAPEDEPEPPEPPGAAEPPQR